MSTEIKKQVWAELISFSRFEKGKGWSKRLRLIYDKVNGSVLLIAETPEGRTPFGLTDGEILMLAGALEAAYKDKVYKRIEEAGVNEK